MLLDAGGHLLEEDFLHDVVECDASGSFLDE